MNRDAWLTRNAIERATQRSRKLLEEDFSSQLEGTFDVLRSGTVATKGGAHLSARQGFQRDKIVAAIEHRILARDHRNRPGVGRRDTGTAAANARDDKRCPAASSRPAAYVSAAAPFDDASGRWTCDCPGVLRDGSSTSSVAGDNMENAEFERKFLLMFLGWRSDKNPRDVRRES